ncbi:unnamed protein product [Macrosiphum euphorbiae]|uniref:Uncharacterized protein n=1 Tax=Macrosiphum euphorbiae TaxID=13131 RepID=A0AAV0X2F2_9HEMI|nr:unnamed protein product [Macrosiphum euphorbiae]
MYEFSRSQVTDRNRAAQSFGIPSSNIFQIRTSMHNVNRLPNAIRGRSVKGQKNKNVQFCTHLEYRQHQQDDGAKSGAIHFRVGGSGGEKILERRLFRGRRENEKNPKTDVQYTIKT